MSLSISSCGGLVELLHNLVFVDSAELWVAGATLPYTELSRSRDGSWSENIWQAVWNWRQNYSGFCCRSLQDRKVISVESTGWKEIWCVQSHFALYWFLSKCGIFSINYCI